MWKQDKNTSFAGESILDALPTHVDIQGDETAYTFLKSDDERLSITYRELDQSARNIAHGLLQKCNPGDRALLMYPAGLDFIQAFIGCLYAGVVAVPAYAPKKNRNAERILLIAKDCTPRLLLCDSETAQNVRGEIAESMENASVVVTNELDWKHEGPLPLLKSDQLAFLQYTSGSTADPKGVMVTHGNIVANEVLIERAFCHDSSAVVVGWLPMFHDMGLIGNILQPLFVGCHSILMSPTTFLRAPYLWLKAVTEYKATTTGAPNFAYDLCAKKITDQQKKRLNLASLKIAYNGAEPVRASTLEGFQRAFNKCGFNKDAWFPCYGLAETTLLVSGGPPLTNTKIVTVDATELERHLIIECDDGQQIVSCGQVGPDLDVRIVDPELFRECKSNEVGEIWTHGASVANGYWKRPQETHESFRAKLHGDNREWFRTGDYGFLRDGDLYITGRLKDLIFIRGRNIYPQDIEKTVEEVVEFVGPNSCAAVSIEVDNIERLAIVIEANRPLVRNADMESKSDRCLSLSLIHRIRERINEDFNITAHSVTFVRPGTFPRTSSGKVQRKACRQGLVDATHSIVLHDSLSLPAKNPDMLNEVSDSVNATDFTNVASVVEDIIVGYLQRNVDGRLKRIDHSTPLDRCGVDSVAVVEISVEIEKRLRVPLSPKVLTENRTVGALASYILGSAQGKLQAAISGDKSPQKSNTILFDAYQRSGCTPATKPSSVDRPTPTTPLTRQEQFDFFRLRNERVNGYRANNQYYFQTEIDSQDAAWVQVEGRRLLMMASYSYLGLIGHHEIVQASVDASAKFGTGVHGVRLLAGTNSLHKTLEHSLAEFMRSDAAIVFSSGFLTNVATIGSVVDQNDVIFADEWVHASLVDGCRFSQAKTILFRHNNLKDLAIKLQSTIGNRRLVIVDAVYSMEGDIAPIPEIVEICRENQALLMVDEAHSLGVLGKNGRGIQEHFGLPADAIDIKMGTLSKAIPSGGGFVAGNFELIDYLRHHARGYIFSGAPIAPQVASAIAGLDILNREPERVDRLRRNAQRLKDGLRKLNYRIPQTQSAIIPVLFDSEQQALLATGKCREEGLFVIPVFYPAVPIDTPRIRCSVLASHTDDDIDFALDVFRKVKAEMTS